MLNSPVIFIPPVPALVKALKAKFADSSATYPILSTVRIASKKLIKQTTPMTKEIIISTTGARTLEGGLIREQGFSLLITCKEYDDVETLAVLTEALLVSIKGLHGVRWVEINLSAIDASETTLEEVRYLTCTAQFIASSFNL